MNCILNNWNGFTGYSSRRKVKPEIAPKERENQKVRIKRKGKIIKEVSV